MHIKKLNNEQLCYASHASSFQSPGRTVGVCPLCVKVAASRSLAEKISLKSSDFDDVCLSQLVPTHSPPTVFFLSLPASHSIECLPVFHMLSLSLLSELPSLRHSALSICPSHGPPVLAMFFLAGPVCWRVS